MNENVKRAKLDQRRAPIHEALEKFRERARGVRLMCRVISAAAATRSSAAFLGQQMRRVGRQQYEAARQSLPPGVVSFRRRRSLPRRCVRRGTCAFLMVGGTTSSVQSDGTHRMIKRGDEINSARETSTAAF